MMNHTPGPWRAQCEDCAPDWRGDSGIRFVSIYPRREPGTFRGTIASIHDGEHIGGITLDERDANARLIAAAPDLLEVLTWAVTEYGRPGGPWNAPSDPGGWLAAARCTIAKATDGWGA